MEIAAPIGAGREALGGVQLGFSTESIEAEIRAITTQRIQHFFVLILAGTGVSYLMAQHLVRPMRRLVGATQKVAAGEFEFSAWDERSVEIAELTHAFAHMTSRLQAFRADVEKRTTELGAANEKLELEITERKRADEALARQTQELARSNAELEQFAYIASHDLQEPLRMVSSYTQLLARRYRGQLDSDADDFIAFAVDGAERMQPLIRDLLEYSRIGSRGNAPEPTNLEEVLDAALANLTAAIEESDAEVTRDPLPTLSVDASQLTQLFQNLIGNALKFRHETPRVHVSAVTEEDLVTFSVRDNGIGIQSDYVERIFAIFQRLHTRDEYAGTGIGLAVCRRIVERHDGRIWAESEPGVGTTFYFTLPPPVPTESTHAAPA